MDELNKPLPRKDQESKDSYNISFFFSPSHRRSSPTPQQPRSHSPSSFAQPRTTPTANCAQPLHPCAQPLRPFAPVPLRPCASSPLRPCACAPAPTPLCQLRTDNK
ncbi:hypothetical protein ACOSQ4_009102 [Xanthoceras sorbifolium]